MYTVQHGIETCKSAADETAAAPVVAAGGAALDLWTYTYPVLHHACCRGASVAGEVSKQAGQLP